MGGGKKSAFDPRAGLWILVAANIIAFSNYTLWVELALIALLLASTTAHRRFTMAVKWAIGYCTLLVFQQVILSTLPMIIAASPTIFATYTRRMFPYLMIGSLMLKCTLLRYLVVGSWQLRILQKLTVAISVALRYFPAIREEIGHIQDAMKLRSIRGLSCLEYTVIPLMVSATKTVEEFSAAAVTRGIKNPVRKTSAVFPCLIPADLTGILLILALLISSFVIQ